MIGAELIGRRSELLTIANTIDAASGDGASLLIKGEAGIGKSALLAAAHCYAEARGFRILRTAGVETETALGYAGLHRLLRPLLATLDLLPEIQRSALRAAVGLASGSAGEPFLVALAILELLGGDANPVPVVIVADDLHWLDAASRTVLAIVGRRARGQRLAMITSIRDGYELTGVERELPALSLAGVDPDSAAEILAGRNDALTDEARRRLIRDAAGNPLALIELPPDTIRREATMPDGAPPPIGERLEHAFASRARRLPARTQRLLLIASADERVSVAEMLNAAAADDAAISEADLAAAIEADLIRRDGTTVHYRHPLVRSAIYQGAPLAARLAAHAALADEVRDPDRRAWHRAAASATRNDAAADELDALAARALARGATLEATAALSRAAELTETIDVRADRYLRAAEIAFQAGRPDLVHEAVEHARRLSLGPRHRAQAELLAESSHDGVAGDVSRVEKLIEEARETGHLGDAELALRLLLGAAVRCWWGALDASVRDQVLTTAEGLHLNPHDPRLMAITACAAPLTRGAEIISLAGDALDKVGKEPLGRWFIAMSIHAAGDHQRAVPILSALIPTLRDQGQFGLLTQALSMLQWNAVMLEQWPLAEQSAAEGDRLARDTGQRIWGAGITCGLSVAAAIRGDAERADQLACEAEAIIVPHGLADMHSVLICARGIAALRARRPEDAFAILQRAFDSHDPGFHYREQFGALKPFVEAAVASGHTAEARATVDALLALAGAEAAPALRDTVTSACLTLGRGTPNLHG